MVGDGVEVFVMKSARERTRELEDIFLRSSPCGTVHTLVVKIQNHAITHTQCCSEKLEARPSD